MQSPGVNIWDLMVGAGLCLPVLGGLDRNEQRFLKLHTGGGAEVGH